MNLLSALLLLCSACSSVCCAVLRSHVFMIRKGVVQNDPRLLTRVLRQLTAVRGQLTAPILRALTKQYLPTLSATLQNAQAATMSDSSSATDGDESEDLSPPAAVEEKKTPAAAAGSAASKAASEQAEKDRAEAALLLADVPEVDIYIQLLVALYFFDKGLKDESVALLSTLFTTLSTQNRRSLDPLSAKIYSYYALLNESLGRAPEIRKSGHTHRDTAPSYRLLCVLLPLERARCRSRLFACSAFVLCLLFSVSVNFCWRTALRVCSTTSPLRLLCPCASCATI